MKLDANIERRIANVLLNGHKMKRVLVADDAVGYIVIVKTGGDGRLKISGNEILRKKLLGKVRIEVVK